jgi:chromosome segregation ATPase
MSDEATAYWPKEAARLKEECARLTRERDEALAREKQNEKYMESVHKHRDRLQSELHAARAHFRRACELLEVQGHQITTMPANTADVWMVRIMVQVNEELKAHGQPRP